MLHKLRPLALSLVMVVSGVGMTPAFAQAPGPVLNFIVQCQADTAELCDDVIPGQGRIVACLYSQMDKLRPRCRNAISAGAALRFCAIDARRFCEGVVPGEGRIAACLAEFRERLSPNCLKAFAYFANSGEDWDDKDEKQLLK